jgi:hypothetical protein
LDARLRRTDNALKQLQKGTGRGIGSPTAHLASDDEVFAQFRMTIEATGGRSARVRDLLAHQGREYHDVPLGEKVQLAHALGRLELRGKVKAQRTKPQSWSLAS